MMATAIGILRHMQKPLKNIKTQKGKTMELDLNEVKEVVNTFPLIEECEKVKICKATGQEKHIEIQFTTKNPQEARLDTEKRLSEIFPRKKFRLLVFRVK